MDAEDFKPWIMTYTGQKVYLLDPDPDTINIIDIAHSLAHTCRWVGQTRHFYSVAQHSLVVSGLVIPEKALAGLMHDASEAYLGDVSKPLKAILPQYKKIENRFMEIIADIFDFSEYLDDYEIKNADLLSLSMEAEQLMPRDPTYLDLPTMNEYYPLEYMPVAKAENTFLDRYMKLVQLSS